MSEKKFIRILIAEDNDVTRQMMASVLRTQGYEIYEAIDGTAAIEIIDRHDIDLALVDVNMQPAGGFEFVRHKVLQGYRTPVVIITSDESADLLEKAGALDVAQVFQKPVDPDRLLRTVERILKRQGLNPGHMGVTVHQTKFSPEELMEKAVALADKNVKSGRGGPFGAVVSDKEGQVLGEGVNGITARADPTAHAEVMAIRQAAEKLSQTDLSECVLYCSSAPTKIGEALIESVGIQEVYYGLSHDDVAQIRSPAAPTSTPAYKQIGQDAALDMLRKWQS